ncbi:hypothetical protein CDL15_Pgr029182 [Punica granatum]|uniref:Uncharacterized protein n=1 Tax=Punica granatum TaxID=22663 RepID=A0A218XEA8_PUNGR|nr:hypothetical protein CDL15_Pgr029182 [Punica granatum]
MNWAVLGCLRAVSLMLNRIGNYRLARGPNWMRSVHAPAENAFDVGEAGGDGESCSGKKRLRRAKLCFGRWD